MDTLRQMSVLEGISAKKDVPVFHEAFLSSIKRFGRIHELSMIVEFTLRSEGPSGLMRQAGMGLSMFTKGKIKLLPRLRPSGHVRNIFMQTEGKQ